MGELVQFVPRPDPNREERLQKRMIEAAQAIYAEIFPDTSPSEYCAPTDDSA